MHLLAEALVLAVRAHGEHGVVARLLTPVDGLQPGYVPGGRSRRVRPVLLPGNVVRAELRARSETQLAALSVELIRSRAPLLAEPLPAAAVEWLTALTAAALPEGQPYPRLFATLAAVLDAVEAAPAARGWAGALVRYELMLLAELGFGLDLSRCAATGGSEDLAYVSPRSGSAVSRVVGLPYAERLFRLPPFLADGGEASWPELFDGLAVTRHFLARDVLIERRSDVLAARDRLSDRLRRLA